MTTGFDTQPTSFATIPRTAPRPQIVGSKLDAAAKPPQDRPPEQRSFGKKPGA